MYFDDRVINNVFDVWHNIIIKTNNDAQKRTC